MLTPEINIFAIIVAAIIPNAFGALYYGFIFEKPWLKSLGMTSEDMKGRNELLIYGLSFLMAFIVAFFLNFIIGMVHKDVNAAGELILASHHTFDHGFLHGSLLAFTFVAPVIVSLGLFQKNTAKNILINVVFWIICFGLMGGIVDVWQ